MSHPLRWDPELTRPARGRPILRDPLRSALGVAALIMAVGSVLPWAEGLIGFLPKHFGGFDGASDGLILFVIAGAVGVIVRSAGFLDAADGARRWTPLALGFAAVAIWLIGRQQGQFEIGRWEDQGGHGAFVPGFWIAGVGAILVALTGGFASLRPRGGPTGIRSILSLFRPPRVSDIPPIAATIGGVLGIVAGAVFALVLFPAVTLSAAMIFFAGIGMVLGSMGGGSLGRRIQGLVR